jgi:hypothetical protein
MHPNDLHAVGQLTLDDAEDVLGHRVVPLLGTQSLLALGIESGLVRR